MAVKGVDRNASEPERRTRGGVPRAMRVNREDVLDRAQEVFAERGYRATNLSHVASQIGVTRQALYYHFPRKVDVLLALFSRVMDYFELAADAIGEEGEEALLFDRLLESHARIVARNIDLVTILLSENAELPADIRPDVQARRRAYTDRLIDAYRDGVTAGQLTPSNPKFTVYTLLGALNCMYRWYHPTGPIDPDEMAAMSVDLLAKGYRAH